MRRCGKATVEKSVAFEEPIDTVENFSEKVKNCQFRIFDIRREE